MTQQVVRENESNLVGRKCPWCEVSLPPLVAEAREMHCPICGKVFGILSVEELRQLPKHERGLLIIRDISLSEYVAQLLTSD